MTYLLIIDTETTGLDVNQHRVIEVAAILYSIPHQTTVQQFSTLLWSPDNPAEPINRIPATVLSTLKNQNTRWAWHLLHDWAEQSQFVVAHNAAFDQQWFNNCDLPELPCPWLCTMEDFKWPLATKLRDSLVNLALAHGIGVGSAHRALTDCQLIAALFDRMDNLPAMIEIAKQPKVFYQALVNYENRELAKKAGFQWHPEVKEWRRRMRPEETLGLPFPVQELEVIANPFPSGKSHHSDHNPRYGHSPSPPPA